jgi:hypothetical protein
LHCNLLRCRCFRFASALLAGRSALHLGRGRGPASGLDFALLRRLVRKEKEK